jgi:hypothetical protein
MDTTPPRVMGCPTSAPETAERVSLTKDELKRLIGEALQKS